MPDDRLKISETFVSIQGEGMCAGVPSWFVRASGCNLRCAWCDTPYASWSPEGEVRPLDDLMAEANTLTVRHAVLTGGEPMLFPAMIELSSRLRAAGWHTTIETAGTIHTPVDCDLMSLSPKLANSTPTDDPRDPDGTWAERHEQRRLNLDTLQGLIDDHPVRQLKFVVASPGDLAEIEDLIARLDGLRPDEIHLMPEGVAPAAPGEHAWITQACIDRGWRYCRRIHIDLFGDTRGT